MNNEVMQIFKSYNGLDEQHKNNIKSILLELGEKYLEFYHKDILAESYKIVMLNIPNRKAWCCLRKFVIENSELEDFGISYVANNCLKKYVAYIFISIELYFMDNVSFSVIIEKFLKVGEILDEYCFKFSEIGSLNELLDSFNNKKFFNEHKTLLIRIISDPTIDNRVILNNYIVLFEDVISRE